MHNHDLDLIAALAEGRLDDEEARLAEESLAGCSECLADLAAQRTSLAATVTAQRPGLSMAESSDLRRQVGAALGLSKQVDTAPQRRPWMGLATAAAVVVALVAVAPLVNLLSTDSDDSSATATTIPDKLQSAEIPAAGSAATTASPATEAPTTEAAAQAPSVQEDGAGVGALERDALPQSRLNFGEVEELERFLSSVTEGIDDQALTRALTLDEMSYYVEQYTASTEEVSVTCPRDEVVDLDGTTSSVITIGTADFAGTEFLVLLVTLADETQVVLAVDAATCEVLAQVEP